MVELAIKNEQWSLYKIVDSTYTIYIYDRHAFGEVELIALLDNPSPKYNYQDVAKIKMKRERFLELLSIDFDNLYSFHTF